MPEIENGYNFSMAGLILVGLMLSGRRGVRDAIPAFSGKVLHSGEIVHNSKMIIQKNYIRFVCVCAMIMLSGATWGADLEALLAQPKDHHAEIIAEVDKAEATYKQRLIVEPLLIQVLKSGAYSIESKTFIAEQLYRICDEDTVSSFVTLLYRNDTGALAAKGLGLVQHSNAQDALLEALPKVGLSTRTAVIEALGDRGDDSAIPALSRYVRSSNRETSEATLIALGKIGGLESAQILGISRLSVHKSLHDIATEAYFQCGWTALERDDHPTALDVFDSLFIEIEPLDVRAKALRGLIRTEEATAMPYIMEALQGGESLLQTVAAEEAALIPGSEATKALVKIYPDLKAPLQALIVAVLGKRSDEFGMPTVILAAQSRDPQVRFAALEALSLFEEPQVLQPLLKASSEGTPEEQTVARASLNALQGDGINHALAKMLLIPDNAVRLEAVKLMPIRGVTEGVPGLVRIIEKGDIEIIQFEALKALCSLGTSAELPLLIKAWVGTSWSLEQRSLIGEGIIAVALRSPAGRARVDALHDALKGSGTPEAQLAVIEALRRIEEDESVDELSAFSRKATPSVQVVVLEVLAQWPTVAALSELEKQARTQDDVHLRDVAYVGLVRLLTEVADPTDSDTVRYCQKAAKVANTTEERRALLPVIATLPREEAEKIWSQLLKADDSLSDDIVALRAE